MSPSATQPALPPERVAFLLESAAAASAVAAAGRLGILDRLDVGPVDTAALVRDCGVSERGAELLLRALAGLGLIVRGSKGSYQPAAEGLASLWPLFEPWEWLPAGIQNGRPVAAGDTPEGAQTLYPDLVPVLSKLFAPAAQRAADLLVATGPRILDVGAGAAPWSLALASRDPARHVTAVDLPKVISVTRNAVSAAGLEAQFEFVGADIFAAEWQQPQYDLVLAANVCHLFDDETNLRLLRCLFDALRPGGTLAIVDIVPNEQLDGPRPAVLYALGLLLRSGTGRAYPFSVYTEWLDRAGLKKVGRHELSVAPPFTLITAGRP